MRRGWAAKVKSFEKSMLKKIFLKVSGSVGPKIDSNETMKAIEAT